MTDLSGATARIDREGRLLSADAPLDALQRAAGAEVGQPLAIPQMAALARSAQSLMVALSKPIVAADDSHDFELWVRADPDEGGVTLTVEQASERAAAPARLERMARIDLDEAEPAAPVVMEWAVDSSLAMTEMSDELAAAIEADQWLGVPLTRLFRLVETEDGTLPLLAALAAREDFADQAVEPRHGGDPLHLAGEAILGADGRFQGFRGTARRNGAQSDVASEATILVDEALDAAMRSPLDLIIDAADRIVERSEGPLRSDYAGYASDIAQAGRHLLEVIRSMNMGGEGAAEPIDLAAAVNEAAALVRPSAEKRHIAIEIDRPEERVAVIGERRGIVQIVVNILNNAIRHSPDGGTVAVVFDADPRKAAVTVADQGDGIPQADQARIFERYEQSGPPDKAAQGTGLGLAISRRLARTMGGDIDLVSAAGEGARFTLTLRSA